ncbi:MAG: S-layer homology domain-containing protein [Clostridiales bacterium]|nr:S-layer homology domain-containing protein [Clostridiales bacterium]
MKKISLLSVVSMLVLAASVALGITVLPVNTVKADGDIQIDETNFPDENFRNWLKSQTYGTDGILTVDEIASVTEIRVEEQNITDLTGIENFTALNTLYCYSNQLTSLDVSKNTKLKTLGCSKNQLTSLNVSTNTGLKWLNCGLNQLTQLDVSNCTALETIICYSNQLTSLDVSKHTSLAVLRCYDNKLTSLDVRNSTSLIELRCSENQLTSLDVTKNTLLEVLYCYSNNLTSLDLGNKPKLTNLGCSSNKLTSLNINSAPKLRWLNCDFNKLTSLDVSGSTALETLYCSSNKLTSLIIGNNTSLKVLHCELNQLADIDVSSCTALVELDCSKNRLIGLEVKNNTKLTTLNCSENPLGSLDVSNNSDLIELSCYQNKLTDLDVKNNTALEKLICYSNLLTGLDVDNNTVLNTLRCHNNNLTSLDVGKNIALKHLDCGTNELTSLDVSNNSALIELWCYQNKLTDLDVTKNIALRKLSFYSNQLTGLDVSKNTALVFLSCYSNPMTGLDVSQNPELTDLYCNYNKLTGLDVSMNTKLSYLNCIDNSFIKVYLPKESEKYNSSNGVKRVVLTPADWKFSGVEWIIDNDDPSKTKAFAKFDCIKEGEEDYKVKSEMDVKNLSFVAAGCENAGNAEYTASLSPDFSRTGEAITEPKTVEVTAKGHKWGEWTVTTPATVGKTGVKIHTCSVCGKSETATVAKLTPTPTATPSPTAKPAVKPTGTPAPTKAATVSLALNKKTANIICGKTLTLKATLKGSSSKITWKSSDTKIATVDASGKIKAKMAGEVTITATAAGKSAKCTVTVLYKDVTNTKDFWYAPTNYLTAKGVVKGYDKQTKFKPANKCTRAQMVTFIWRLQGEPKPKTSKCKFSDVKKTDYFYKACIWGNENHIVEGYKDGTFGPQIVCARKHAVTFLWRLANKPKPTSTKNKFKDVKKSDYFYQATLWASEKKILAGYSDGTFRPNGDCLRRQMVTFLYKYDKFVNNK